jgi:hypothetical protein
LGKQTGTIRPAGRRDIIVTVAGVDFDTPDTLIQEYIRKKENTKLIFQTLKGKWEHTTF